MVLTNQPRTGGDREAMSKHEPSCEGNPFHPAVVPPGAENMKVQPIANADQTQDNLDRILKDLLNYYAVYWYGKKAQKLLQKVSYEKIDKAKQAILKHYIPRSEVEAAIGEDDLLSREPTDLERILRPDVNRVRWRNQLRQELREKLLNKDQ